MTTTTAPDTQHEQHGNGAGHGAPHEQQEHVHQHDRPSDEAAFDSEEDKKELGCMSLWSQCPEQHAFVMCGTDALFLVHLTMFKMEEHCFQVVLRAHLTPQATMTYLDAKRRHPSSTFFLANASVDGVMMPDFNSGRRREFLCDIFQDIPEDYKGDEWPWAHEHPIVSRSRLTIERVVYYRHFDFMLPFPPMQTYLMFGEGNEAFLYHYQVKEPDYDEVVALKSAPAWLPASTLEAGLHVNFDGISTTGLPPCESLLKAGRTYDVHYGQQPLRPIAIDRSYWFSTRVVNANDPCAHQHPCPGTPCGGS